MTASVDDDVCFGALENKTKMAAGFILALALELLSGDHPRRQLFLLAKGQLMYLHLISF